MLMLIGGIEMPAADLAGPQAYVGYYTGAIMPTPQQVEYSDEFLPVLALAGLQPLATVVVGPEAPSAETIAAQEIALRVAHLGQGKQLPIVTDAAQARTPLVIALGQLDTNPANARLVRDRAELAPPDHWEGYHIGVLTKGARTFVACTGSDDAGSYFAAQTLVQLFKVEGRQVLLQRVEVHDYPAFRVRSFKVGGAYKPEADRGDARELMGLWAPWAKFNCYNICYTTLGPDRWKNPRPEYVDYVQRMTRFQRARGLDCMPFVNPYYLWKEHIKVTQPKDLEALAKTCSIALEAGGRRVMLCLDDFASRPKTSGKKLYTVYSKEDAKKFDNDLAQVNIAMINDLHSRLRAEHPNCELFVVLPYYWSPGGSWKEEGERYLRAVGQGIPRDVVIVWTGPRVRSLVVSKEDVEYYQGLVGRKCFLWDNTLYAHHRPPHFFLDPFVTKYPDKFWELSWGGVHLNAGSGEAYKAGLLAASDYLWHPEGYDPERAMRLAVAAIVGPETTDCLLEFRDSFYDMYDNYRQQFGKPEELWALAKKLKARPVDEEDLRQMRAHVTALHDAAQRVCDKTQDEALVEEVQGRARQFDGYLEAFEALLKLPAPQEVSAENMVENPGGEEVEHELPKGWGSYTGAGKCRLRTSEEHHLGQRSIELETTEWYEWGGGRRSINCAVMAGRTNGFTGQKAPEIAPFTKYYFSFWLKGDWPEVTVSFVGWSGTGQSAADRVMAKTTLEPFAPTSDWKRYQGSFVTPATAVRGALKIGISKFEDEGAKLGTIWIDDLFVGRRPAPEGVPPQPPPPPPPALGAPK